MASQEGIVPCTPPVPSVHSRPLVDSYSWRSDIPPAARSEPCILGVDEAGRGPVLGPLVYGIAYCPASFSEELKEVGFADSKALTAERRDTLLAALIENGEQLGWATRTMSPQDISAGMLRKRPFNLNTQSTEATVELISGVLEAGIDVSEIYVDTVGDPSAYTRTLKSYFPQAKYKHINWTVCSKADAIYPIVGAASIAAKVTRDRWVEDWRYGEDIGDAASATETETLASSSSLAIDSQPPSPVKKGTKKRKRPEAPIIDVTTPRAFWHDFGSGYPGDPSTVAYLQRSLDPVFGWPGVVRFSWATIKTLLEEKSKVKPGKQEGEIASPAETTITTTGSILPPGGQPRGYKVRWVDEAAQITNFFATRAGGGAGSLSATAGPQHITSAMWKENEEAGKKERKGLMKDLGIASVGPGMFGL